MRKVIPDIAAHAISRASYWKSRFMPAGWEIIVNYMINEAQAVYRNGCGKDRVLDEKGESFGPLRSADGILQERRHRVSDPGPWTWTLSVKTETVSTGPPVKAAAIVVTEYDIPRRDERISTATTTTGTASDWSRGIRSSFQESVSHDAVLSTDAMFISRRRPHPERTVGKLNPRTGVVTSFKRPAWGKKMAFARARIRRCRIRTELSGLRALPAK